MSTVATAPLVTRRDQVAGFATRVLELDGEGAPFVLIHGLTDCADFWRPTLARLATAGRRALAVDLPGFAEAGPLGPGAVLPQHDRFLDALLDDVVKRTGEPAIVVGHSMGGCLALRLAQRDPDGLAGVVAAPPSGFDMPRVTAVLRSRTTERALVATRHLPLRIRRRTVALGWRLAALADRNAASPEFLDAYSGYFCANVAGYARASRLVIGEMPSSYQLERIRRPLLLIWGDADRLATPRSAQRILADVPGSRLETVPGCGHCPAIEAPDRLTAALVEFAEEIQHA